jgi:hypothetical protein
VTLGEVATMATIGISVAGALGQGALSLARVYMLRERVKALETTVATAEQRRVSTGERMGQIEKQSDVMVGRLDELSRSVHGAAAGKDR